MNRRHFLQRASSAVFGVVAFFYCPSVLKNIVPRPVERLGWIVYEEIGTVIVNEMSYERTARN